MKTIIGRIFCTLGLMLTVLFGMLTWADAVATDAELYFRLQMKAGVPEAAGVSEADLKRLDDALADCLDGNRDAFVENGEIMRVTVFGEEQPAFNERELTHMEDCRVLVRKLRKVRNISAGGLLLFALGVLMLKTKKDVWLCAKLSILIWAVPLLSFGLWAATDFMNAFVFFHKMLFTNDLWLLNPSPD